MKFTVHKIKTIFPHIGASIVVIISFANIIVAHKPVQQHEVLAAVDPWEKEVEFWQEIVRLHPTYRDGYIELAELYLKKDLRDAAQQSIEKAIEIDPFSEIAREINNKLKE